MRWRSALDHFYFSLAIFSDLVYWAAEAALKVKKSKKILRNRWKSKLAIFSSANHFPWRFQEVVEKTHTLRSCASLLQQKGNERDDSYRWRILLKKRKVEQRRWILPSVTSVFPGRYVPFTFFSRRGWLWIRSWKWVKCEMQLLPWHHFDGSGRSVCRLFKPDARMPKIIQTIPMVYLLNHKIFPIKIWTRDFISFFAGLGKPHNCLQVARKANHCERKIWNPP